MIKTKKDIIKELKICKRAAGKPLSHVDVVAFRAASEQNYEECLNKLLNAWKVVETLNEENNALFEEVRKVRREAASLKTSLEGHGHLFNGGV